MRAPSRRVESTAGASRHKGLETEPAQRQTGYLQIFLRCLKYAGAPLLTVMLQTAMVYTAISVSVYVRRSGRLRELITLDRLRITFTANVKFKLRISQNKHWHETAYFYVEVINSKQQLRGKLGHVVRIHVCRMP